MNIMSDLNDRTRIPLPWLASAVIVTVTIMIAAVGFASRTEFRQSAAEEDIKMLKQERAVIVDGMKKMQEDLVVIKYILQREKK